LPAVSPPLRVSTVAPKGDRQKRAIVIPVSTGSSVLDM
jgi:hypothetical protein